MTDIDPHELVGRYVAVWNQPDAGLRRAAIRELWAQDGGGAAVILPVICLAGGAPTVPASSYCGRIRRD